MAVAVRIGFDKASLRRTLAKLRPVNVERAVDSAVAEGAEQFLGAAAGWAPTFTGRLASSGRIAKVGPGSFTVTFDAPYARFVAEGTRPHFPPVEAIRPWAEAHGIDPWALAVSISRKGTRANPWWERAVAQELPRLRRSIAATAARNVSRSWRGS